MATSEALDYESRPRLPEEKKRRDALIALAEQQGWVVGYQDEVWWSRMSQPNLHSWSEKNEPLRLQELNKDKNDPDPKALACYGMLEAESSRIHLRFVEGRPVSQVTTDFLEWLCEQVQAQGKHGLVLIWDNASWHVSTYVKTWLREHNQTVLRERNRGGAHHPVLAPHQKPLAEPNRAEVGAWEASNCRARSAVNGERTQTTRLRLLWLRTG